MVALLAFSIVQGNVLGQLVAINSAAYAPSSAAAPIPRQTPAGVSVAPNHRQSMHHARIVEAQHILRLSPVDPNGPGEP